MDWSRMLSPIFFLLFIKVSMPAQEAACSDDAKEVVTAAYRAYLNRAPDPVGLKAYSDYLRSTNSVRMVMIGIAESPEWQKSHGPTTEAKVRALYQMFLNREADPVGLGAYTQAINDKGIENVLHDPNGFSWSDEANAFGQRLPGVGVSWCNQPPPPPIPRAPTLPPEPKTSFTNSSTTPVPVGACYLTTPSGGMPAQCVDNKTKAVCGPKNNWYQGASCSRVH